MLNIFMFDKNIGQGFPFLQPNGTIIKNIIQKYLRQIESKYDYQEVVSPILANKKIYEISGH
jgi:threonyl-tRNA synthetase